MSPVFQRFRNDITGVLWLGLGIFLSLSLYSFHPGDPSFNSTGHSLKVLNFCGYFGSFLADSLYQVLGLTAWVLAVSCFRLSLLAFKGAAVSWKNWRMVWGGLLILTVSSLLALYFPQSYFFEKQIFIGGLLGLIVSKGLVAVFNQLGVTVILWSLALILLIFYTEKSLKEFMQLPWKMARGTKEKSKEKTGSAAPAFPWLRALFAGAARIPQWIAGRLHRSAQLAPAAHVGGLEPLFDAEPAKPKTSFRLKETIAEDGADEDEGDGAEDGSGEQPGSSLLKTTLTLFKKGKNNDKDDGAAEEETEAKLPDGFFPLTAGGSSEPESAGKKRKVKMSTKVERRIENWELPKVDLLEDPPLNRVRIDEREIQRKADILVDKLSQFSVGGQIVGVKTGPAVTLFEFKPNADVKISKINELADDLSLALSAESVRIIAPIPGRDVVGIETSNTQRETVYLKDVVVEREFWKADMKLPMALGRQADGIPKIVDLRKMPHLLVAGTTGSGKSVFVVSSLMGLLFKHSPKTLRLILVDPKQVDLAAFSRVPHLLMPPIREPQKAVSALRWAINEMEKRYRSMSKFGARGIEGFNDIVGELSGEDLQKHADANLVFEDEAKRNEMYYYTPQPYIVIVVEEFGDLMAVDKGNVEQAVVRLAQMARACGIHLILAMQSPRKDVVTGLIKTNIPGRISFKVASKMDSRIILDDSGAERLLARGDMLFLAPGVAKPERHHGPWLSEEEIDRVVSCWADQGEPQFDELAMRALEGSGGGFDLPGGGGDDAFGDEDINDDRYDEILSWVSTQKAVSASLLQRKFRLGYPRAARMIEIFEQEGVVGPANGSKPRQVLVNSYSET